MTNYAQISERNAGLWTDFGLSFAQRLFGDDALAELPRFTRGKNKGKIKAVIVWRKIDRGGWVKEHDEHGHVESRVGKIVAAAIHECAWPEPFGAVIKTLTVA